MQEKTLLKPKTRISNIHSMDFGAISYDIFGSPYQKSGSFLADDSLDFGYLGKPYNADTELYDFYQTNEVIKKTIPAAIESGNINSTKEPSKNSFLDTCVSIFQNLF
ncbi:MAG: hypothetical protein UIH41_08120 [Treponemataceae bacterium]|nr:hypothetical protein [Treponemataceae bacterium]